MNKDDLVDKCAALKTGDLTPPHVWNFEVSVEQKIERECDIFARIVDANVKVKLLFPEDQSIRQSEPEATRKSLIIQLLSCVRGMSLYLLIVPGRSGDFVVNNAENGFNVTRRQSLGRFLDVPADDAGESVLRSVIPRPELSC